SLPRTTQVVFDFQSGKAVPRLREPRNLYGVTGLGPRNMPRWPQECEVIPDKIHHIEWAPSSPEPIYSPCNLKKVPLQETEPREATLVYMADGADKEPFFIGSRVGGSWGPLKSAAVPFLDPGDSTLVFEARFESGNLQTALKVGEHDYELTLRTDLYTDRHTQWYYFRVINTRANMRYRFTITNLLKMSSLYAEGQRPLLYSQKEAESQGVGWHRVGEEVCYYRNGRQQSGHSCYSLTWTCTFPHDKDTCYFAHCYPYTYSNLREYLSRISQDPVCSSFSDKEPFFIGSRVGGSWGPLKSAAVPFLDPGDSTLVFEARFESGNLQTALKVGEHDYELTLRTDLYTDRHTQWYYFRVINTRANMRYRFTITNLLKMSSLYAEGQRPLLYSQKEAESQGVGWHRVGEEVRYYRNGRQQSGHSCYSLTWTCTFPHDKDTCYFAHCYPYTYSNLREYLSRISQDPVCSSFCKIRTLCLSLAGNLVPILTVTSPSLGNQMGGRKPAVVLTARIHPGETNSSWVMKGILDFLLGSSADAALLRDSFIFKLVPMLNPNGVIVGNYRCSLTGRDLNRNYKSILRESFPTVWATRSFIQRLCEERELLLYCDLHGHSRKANVFMYGCESDDQSELCKRVFPLMLSKNCPDMVIVIAATGIDSDSVVTVVS
ncbi:UNVERIFIED_CONTAM: hypothetical protein FKN15_011940, partial [Acipenser sinensis]